MDDLAVVVGRCAVPGCPNEAILRDYRTEDQFCAFHSQEQLEAVARFGDAESAAYARSVARRHGIRFSLDSGRRGR